MVLLIVGKSAWLVGLTFVLLISVVALILWSYWAGIKHLVCVGYGKLLLENLSRLNGLDFMF